MVTDRYRLSFTTGGLFLQQAPLAAERYLTLSDWSQTREVVRRDNQWLPVSDLITLKPREEVRDLNVRVRTIGDITCTGCIESEVADVPGIIAEIAAARVTERGSRADDKRSETAMEDRKREGYF